MKLFVHQQKLLDEFPKRHALIWNCGTGKTRVSLELAAKVGEPFLIICPKGLKKNWAEEIKKWGKELPHLVVSKEEFKRDHQLIAPYKGVIVDEFHAFLGMKSQMMKSLKKYFQMYTTEYRYFLSATPYRSSPWDIYKMCELIGKPLNYSWFERTFFNIVPMAGRMIPVAKKDIEPQIAELVQKVGSTVKLEDCFDVPTQSYETEYFDLTPEQKKAIANIKEILPIVRYGQEHQITGGTLKSDGYSPTQEFKSDKMDRLLEIVQDNNRTIVVCKYLHEVEVLMDKMLDLKLNVAKITGKVEDRHEILEILKRSSKYVLLVSAACCEGWELSDCPLMVFYSLDFQMLHEVQMRGRIQRGKNIKKNTYIYLTTKGSIDEEIFKTITIKKRNFLIEIYNERQSRKD
jgi:superfamily II DNA or RNA helicase